MAFKMKGPSLYPKMNTATRLSQKLNVDHSANTATGDGRAKSSAFQMKDDKKKKTKEQLIKEGFTPADADKMRADGAVTGEAIAKQIPKKPSQGDFEPAYPGADYSKADIAKMSEKEKQSKIDGYTPKKAKKSTTSAHGQLDDAQVEYENDKKMIAEMNKKKSKKK